MLRMIRSAFSDPQTIDAVDSYENQKEGLLEEELQRAGDFYASGLTPEDEDDTSNVYMDADGYERTPSAVELEYYADYDVTVGYRIAISLGILIVLFTVFVLYKTHCHQQKNRRLTQSAQS